MKVEDAPKRLKDYLDPKWKGKIMEGDPLIGVGAYLTWVPYLRKGIIDEAFLRALGKKDLIFQYPQREAANRVARGDAPLSSLSTESSFGPLAKEGAPIKALPLEEGSMLAPSLTQAAIKNVPHPNAALVFLNWRLSQEGQMVYHGAKGTRSPRNDVPDFRNPNAIAGSKQFFAQTEEDVLEGNRLFKEKKFVDLLGRK